MERNDPKESVTEGHLIERKHMNKLIAVVVVSFLLSASAIGATPQYSVIDLGSLPGGNGSQALCINDNGQVGGWAYTGGNPDTSAFLYSGGSMQDIGKLTGGNGSQTLCINDSGKVGGYEADYRGFTAFLYSGGTMQIVDDLIAPGVVGMKNFSEACGINSSGQIAGLSIDTSGRGHAFLSSSGSVTVLCYGVATAINNNGQVVGQKVGTVFTGDAFLYSGGSLQDLGTLQAPYNYSSYALAVNDNGQVVGYSYASNYAEHAFLYSGDSMTDLGTLAGETSSQANAINDSGLIVGQAYSNSEPARAFLDCDGTMEDLNSLTSTSGWLLINATGINDNGQICGYGVNPQGQTDAFILDPIETPEPSTLVLIAAGGIVLLGHTWRKQRKGPSLSPAS